MKEKISRRSFLQVLGLGLGAAVLTACTPGAADSPPTLRRRPSPTRTPPLNLSCPWMSFPASTAPRPASP